MRLFKSTGIYVYASCTYAVNAVAVVFHYQRNSASPRVHSLDAIVVLTAISMLFLATVALFALKKTSSALERCALVMTNIIGVMIFADYLMRYGFGLPKFSYFRPVFVAVNCAVTIVAGWRTVQVIRGTGS